MTHHLRNTTTMNKLTKEQTFISMALSMAGLSKCVSHKVCALIVKDNRVISTGINGTAHGRINCCDYCESKGWLNDDGTLNQVYRQDHSKWSKINELHAELNAICNSARLGISLEDSEMYCTLAPCNDCAKIISSAGIKKLYYYKEYDNPIQQDLSWKQILEESGVKVEKVDL